MTCIPDGWWVGTLHVEWPVVVFLTVPWYVLCGVLWVLGSFCVFGFGLMPAWWPLFGYLGSLCPGCGLLFLLVCPFDVLLVWLGCIVCLCCFIRWFVSG